MEAWPQCQVIYKCKEYSIADYRQATGFEAVMGYLYMKGSYHRMIDLIKLGLQSEKEDENGK